MAADFDWVPWTLGSFHPPECGGHFYAHSDVQLADFHRKGEKAFLASHKFQVLHHHEQGRNCNSECEAVGQEVPRVAR